MPIHHTYKKYGNSNKTKIKNTIHIHSKDHQTLFLSILVCQCEYVNLNEDASQNMLNAKGLFSLSTI